MLVTYPRVPKADAEAARKWDISDSCDVWRGPDRIAERLAGLTLLMLGIYVLGSLMKGGDFAPRSRIQIIASSLR